MGEKGLPAEKGLSFGTAFGHDEDIGWTAFPMTQGFHVSQSCSQQKWIITYADRKP